MIAKQTDLGQLSQVRCLKRGEFAMQRPDTFMPQAGFVLTKAGYFSDFDEKIAISLYQPLVGPIAMALYLSLWQEVKDRALVTDRRPQLWLLDLLDIDIDQLFVARVKLEAVGLLRTYTQVDSLGRYYAYELYPPVRPDAFFKDDLLGLLLYDKVGEKRYDELVAQFSLKPVRRPEWQEITANFLDVFRFDHNLSGEPSAVVAAKKAMDQNQPQLPRLGNGEGYDWELLQSLLANSNIQSGQLAKHQEALYQIAGFYGIQPPDFARLISRATDVMTGKIDLNALRRLAEQSYTRQQPQTKAQPVATKPPKVASADEALLKRAKSMPPRQFLTAAKQAKNDRMYPANNELRAVQSLSERNVFDAPTINILIDYILRTNDSINQALMDAIANSWLKANVTSPEAALQQIHTFEEQKATGKRRFQSQTKGVRQEKLPDWAKEGYQPKKKKVSEADRQTLAAQLEKLRQLGDKGGTN